MDRIIHVLCRTWIFCGLARFPCNFFLMYNFSVTLSTPLPKAGEGLPAYNASSGISLPAGPAHIAVLKAGKVQMELNISCYSNIDLSLGQWDSNPMNTSPDFDNATSSLFFALEVSNKSAVVFPVVVKINLTDELISALPSGLSNDQAKEYFKFMRWNQTTSKWDDADYSISVDLAEKTIKIIFKSFSVYALGINEPEPKVNPPFSISGYPSIFILTIAVCAIVSILIKNKKHKL